MDSDVQGRTDTIVTGGEQPAMDLSAMMAAVQEHWLGSFVLNLLGYALILLPAALLIRRWKQSTTIKNGRKQYLY